MKKKKTENFYFSKKKKKIKNVKTYNTPMAFLYLSVASFSNLILFDFSKIIRTCCWDWEWRGCNWYRKKSAKCCCSCPWPISTSPPHTIWNWKRKNKNIFLENYRKIPIFFFNEIGFSWKMENCTFKLFCYFSLNNFVGLRKGKKSIEMP